ncbi:MAG: RHS repeat-associated core domain-containing protein [Candidatus Hydrogenedentes bacterium]|nr:RHS repeat-associated core domain-containing protein [Candidatus Hydrogenedentota bacterium]
MAAAAHQIRHTRATGDTRAPRAANLEARPGGLPRTRNPNPRTRARLQPHTAPRPHPGNVRGCTPKKPTYTYGQFGRMTRKTGGDTTKYPGKQIGAVLATSEGTSAATGTWNYPPTADLRHIPSKIRRRRTCGTRMATASVNTNTPLSAANTPTTAKTSPVEDPPQEEKSTGHAWDSEARLYYTAYRYYSPDANRWLTRDPLGMVDGPNMYAYVVNNPVSLIDVDGRAVWAVPLILLIGGTALSLVLDLLWLLFCSRSSVSLSLYIYLLEVGDK